MDKKAHHMEAIEVIEGRNYARIWYGNLDGVSLAIKSLLAKS